MSSSAPSSLPRVRFAPSPTGHLHVGGARTALYNWLFARSSGGVFILRVEDSDRKRSRGDVVDEIITEMSWLGLDWDEGPFLQSRRFELYRKYALGLLKAKKAYEPPSPRGGGKAVICPAGEGKIEFVDLVRGPIQFSTDEIKDIVLLKSDGAPAYNFACVVDDHEMGITHVIRGEDHIPNTPKQLILYRAFGWEPPEFAHLPLILGSDKTPLSKRHGATSVKAFREQGFLPPALMNYLALLGWSPGDDREFLPAPELIGAFSLRRVIKSAAVFDYQKLTWLNGKYMEQLTPEELEPRARQFLEREGRKDISRDYLEAVLKLMGHRLKTLSDLIEEGGYFFHPEVNYEPGAVEKYWHKSGTASLLTRIREALTPLEPFSATELERVLRNLMVELNIKMGDLIHPLRVALTGRPASPGIFETMAVLGKETVLLRLDKALKCLKNSFL